MKIRNIAYIFASLLMLNHNAYAFDFNPELLISGFGNVGASTSTGTEVNFFNPVTFSKQADLPSHDFIQDRVNFYNDTLAGLQFVARINDQFSFTSQFISEGDLEFDVYTAWLYAEWHVNDNWNVKVGRNIMPLFMHSSYTQVNYAYPWTRLPYDFYIYSNQIADMDGVTITHTAPVYGQWWSSVIASAGKAGSNAVNIFEEFNLNKLISAEATLYNDNAKVRIGYTQGRIDLNLGGTGSGLSEVLNNPCAVFYNQLSPSQITIAPSLSGPPACQIYAINSPFPFDPLTQGFIQPDPATAVKLNTDNVPMSIYSAGYEVKWNHLVSIGEWNRFSFNAPLLPSSTSWYVLLGLSWDNFMPYITVASFRTLNDNQRVISNSISGTYVNPFSYFGPEGTTPVTLEQSINEAFALIANGDEMTFDAGIRYDIASKIALKFEYRYILPKRSTLGLFDIPPGKRVSEVTGLIAFIF
jgi:hypothetical protein